MDWCRQSRVSINFGVGSRVVPDEAFFPTREYTPQVTCKPRSYDVSTCCDVDFNSLRWIRYSTDQLSSNSEIGATQKLDKNSNYVFRPISAPNDLSIMVANPSNAHFEIRIELKEIKEVKREEHLFFFGGEDIEFKINPQLSEEDQKTLSSFLYSHLDNFAVDNTQLTQTQLTEHKINTEENTPISRHPYRTSYKERMIIKSQIQEMLANGIISESFSPWASPVVLVGKPDGTFRFCVDYRNLNSITKRDFYPLPRIDDILDQLGGNKYFTTLDLISGYWQIGIAEKDREKTAFITQDGLYEFNRMPFGLKCAPATFQRVMDKVLYGLKGNHCMVYLDDIVIYSKTITEHVQKLGKVFNALRSANLKLKVKKCIFAEEEIKFLGFLINETGFQPDPSKIDSVVNFKRPIKSRDVKSFLGLCSYYRRFIENFSDLTRPIRALIKDDAVFLWSKDCEENFELIKQKLTTAPILVHYQQDQELLVHTDASGYGLGVILSHLIDGKERVICYGSRVLTPAEEKYSISDKECLGIIFAVTKYRPYLYGRQFTIITDHHALCYLMNISDPSGRLCRWALRLMEFDFQIRFKNGRIHKNVDCLSRYPSDRGSCDVLDEFPLYSLISEEEVDLIKSQEQDPWVNKLKKKLIESDPIIKKYYTIEDNLVYFKTSNPFEERVRLCVPASMRKDLIFFYHDHIFSGHLGISKTYEKLKRKYFWTNMRRNVIDHVTSCHCCQMRKVDHNKKGYLQEIAVGKPFQLVSIDMLGPFPLSYNGNKYILVSVDYGTRYAIAKAIPNATAECAADFIISEITLKFGPPKKLLSDRGTNFTSSLVTEILRLTDTKPYRTTAYHPPDQWLS